ncbi:MAG TPA: 4Fe-4S binding protein [Spirochaetota bacterium]|nr:4Fe-4S binding protein [Spirochaetota bacterium]HPS86158.1 4Fe-4S binding protein [Spirochaetota bacterium]
MKKIPIVDQSKCVRCNNCVDICPGNAISVISNSCCAKCIKYCISLPVPCHPEYLTFDYSICNSCGICIDSCSHGVISWTDPETSHLKRIEQQ